MIHIYTAKKQPATRYVDDLCALHPRMIFRNPGNRLLWTICCSKRRPAKNLHAQVFYDQTLISCKSGKGCKK